MTFKVGEIVKFAKNDLNKNARLRNDINYKKLFVISSYSSNYPEDMVEITNFDGKLFTFEEGKTRIIAKRLAYASPTEVAKHRIRNGK